LLERKETEGLPQHVSCNAEMVRKGDYYVCVRCGFKLDKDHEAIKKYIGGKS